MNVCLHKWTQLICSCNYFLVTLLCLRKIADCLGHHCAVKRHHHLWNFCFRSMVFWLEFEYKQFMGISVNVNYCRWQQVCNRRQHICDFCQFITSNCQFINRIHVNSTPLNHKRKLLCRWQLTLRGSKPGTLSLKIHNTNPEVTSQKDGRNTLFAL